MRLFSRRKVGIISYEHVFSLCPFCSFKKDMWVDARHPQRLLAVQLALRAPTSSTPN